MADHEGIKATAAINEEHLSVSDEPVSTEVTVADIKTASIDMRFPSTNQARYCYTRYNEYYKCLKEKDSPGECVTYKRALLSLCPQDWVERWEEARENGAWPGKY